MRVQREDLLYDVTTEWRYVGLNVSAFPYFVDVGGGIAVQLKVRY